MKKVRLLDVCDVYQPQTIATKLFIPDGKYMVYGANGEIGRYDKYNHEEPELLMACRGATCGAINISKPYSWINGNAMVIHPNGKVDLNKDYLKYYLVSVNKDSIISGTAQPQITRQNLKDFKIIICDIDTQKQIVQQIEEQLSKLDSAVKTLKKTKQQLEVYRQAVLKEAFQPLSEYYPITEYFDISSGLTKNSKRNTLELKMPYLRVANVYYDYLDLSEIKTIGVSENEIQQTLLKKNDLLFVEGNGSKSQIGRVAIWDGSIEKILHQNHIIKGRPNGSMLPNYALYFFMSYYGRNQILKVASSTSGLYTLSANKIRNLQIPYCDLAAQQKIISIIEEKTSVCKNIEQTVNQTLQQAEALRQSILKQAFEEGQNVQR